MMTVINVMSLLLKVHYVHHMSYYYELVIAFSMSHSPDIASWLGIVSHCQAVILQFT